MQRRDFLACSVVTPFLAACGGGADEDGAAQDTSRAHPLAVPGQKHTLSWNSAGNWFMDGAAFQFFGGEMHPARVPSPYWDHRIKMIKAMGCNTISLYAMWNFHERSDGSFDFASADKNIGHFIDLCAQNGMWVILRPGPYVCAEWDFGGLPPRMLADPAYRDSSGKLQIRGNFSHYMAAVRQWNAALYNNVVKGRTVSAGGPIMLVALENEYTFWSPDDPAYITALAKQWTDLGYAEKFCVCDGHANGFKDNGLPLPANTAYGMTSDGDTSSNYALVAKNYGVGAFGSENYPGWICYWGDDSQTVHVGDFAASVATLAKAKRSFVMYVAHGGTNFGFTAGGHGNGSTECKPVMTSYDYGAPVREAGETHQSFVPIRDAYVGNASYNVTVGDMPAPIARIVDGEVGSVASSQLSFSPLSSLISLNVHETDAKTIEWLAWSANKNLPASEGLYPAGVVVYETRLPAAGGDTTITFDRAPDFAIAFVNGVRVPNLVLTTVTQGDLSATRSFMVNDAAPNAVLRIVCLPFGRSNFKPEAMNTDGRGLSGKVYANGKALTNWAMGLVPLSSAQVGGLSFTSQRPSSTQPFFARANVSVATPKDMYIDMTGWDTGYVFVNGHNLGRYWTAAGPQKRLFCPGVWLHAGNNTLVVFEFTKSGPAGLSFRPTPLLKLNTTSPISTTPTLTANAIYTLKVKSANLMLGTYQGATAKGTLLAVAAPTGGTEQRWQALSKGSNVWQFKNIKSGLVMDVADEKTANGTAIEVWTSSTGTNQQFTLIARPDGASFAIQGVQSKRVVDANGAGTAATSYGSPTVTAITLWDDHAGSNQSWVFTQVG